MKRIVLCSDGTGNKGGVSKDTNVWRIFCGVDKSLGHDIEQIAFYDDGIGTQRLKFLKIFGGAFGFGLSRNIRDLYEALAKNYEPGDEIYVFGFSRGAYTARVLAALICQVGVLKIDPQWSQPDVRRYVREALRHHRDAYQQPYLTRWLRRWYVNRRNTCEDSETFRKTMSHDGEHAMDGRSKLVEFIGVWDTVSAIGTPIWGLDKLINLLFFRIEFPDFALSHRVARACQALAIDDERETFEPMLWNELDTRRNVDELNAVVESKEGDPAPVGQVACPEIEQVWFSGVHSNVGGGYPKQGLAYASLVWIMQQAGLRFKDGVVKQAHLNVNPNDKLYDSRSGFAAYYRYKPREVDVWSRAATGCMAKIDGTTLERIDQAAIGYSPGNLPFEFEVVDTTGRRPLSQFRSVDAVVKTAQESGYEHVGSLLAAKRKWVNLRVWLHGFLAATTLSLLFVGYFATSFVPVDVHAGTENLSTIATYLKLLLPAALSGPILAWDAIFREYFGAFLLLLLWFAILYKAKYYFHRNSEGAYDEFWSKVRAAWRQRPDPND